MTATQPPATFARDWMRQLGEGMFLHHYDGPLATVAALEPFDARVFLAVGIQGQRFQGVVVHNTLILEHGRSFFYPLGRAVITTWRGPLTAAGASSGVDRRYSLATRRDGGRLSLSGRLDLTEAGRQALAYTFGLPIQPQMPRDAWPEIDPADYFYLSPAFNALRAWVSRQTEPLPAPPADEPLGDWQAAARQPATEPAYSPSAPRRQLAGGGKSSASV